MVRVLQYILWLEDDMLSRSFFSPPVRMHGGLLCIMLHMYVCDLTKILRAGRKPLVGLWGAFW